MKEQAAKVLALNFMGCLWGYIGMNLIRKGLPTIFMQKSLSIAITCALIACAIGFCKSIFVMKKTALRLGSRVDGVKSIFSIFKLMDLKFLILISLMMMLGVGLNLIQGMDIAKGMIRTAIGYSLLQSSFYFFKPAFIYGIRG